MKTLATPMQVQSKLTHLAQVSPRRSRVTSNFAKQLLLSGAGYFHEGKRYATYSKSCGAGVYEVWAEVLE